MESGRRRLDKRNDRGRGDQRLCLLWFVVRVGVTNKEAERGLTVGFLLWGSGRVDALQSLRAKGLE